MIFHSKLKYLAQGAILGFFILFAALPALAQDNKLPPPDAPVVLVDTNFDADEETHPPIRLTGDKSHLLNLDDAVARVIIGNDAHLNILMDTSKRLVLVPKLAGATHFTLLGNDNNVIMQRHVIIAGPMEKYVRIRKTCRELDACMPIRMFYCPGLCHEIAVLGADGTAFSGSIPAAAGEGGGGGDDSGLLPTDLLSSSGGEEE